MSEEQTTEQPVADPVSEEQPPAPVRNEPQEFPTKIIGNFPEPLALSVNEC
jgi:hypothetical protein